MKLSFQLAVAVLLIVIPATRATNTITPSSVIVWIPGDQCQSLLIGAYGAIVKFSHAEGGDIVVKSAHPENWQRNKLNTNCDVSVNCKRWFKQHNGITLYVENGGHTGIAHDGKLYPLPLSDYERILKSTGVLSIKGYTVLAGEKPLTSFSAATDTIPAAVPGDLEIDVPDNFTGLISISTGQNCEVDLGSLHNCSIRGLFSESSITAGELRNMKSVTLHTAASTVHLHNVSTKLLLLSDLSARYPSKYWIDSGAAQSGDLNGLEDNFKLNGDFSTLKRSWVPEQPPHRPLPKPAY